MSAPEVLRTVCAGEDPSAAVRTLSKAWREAGTEAREEMAVGLILAVGALMATSLLHKPAAELLIDLQEAAVRAFAPDRYRGAAR